MATAAKRKRPPDPDNRPLSKAHEKFVDRMVHYNDPKRAAIEAGYNIVGYRHLLKNKRILAEIERRKNLLEEEKAHLAAKRQIVELDVIDKELMAVVQADIGKAPTLAPSKVRAIELGYERIGKSVEGVFVPDAPEPNADGQAVEQVPKIFRATPTQMLTHSIETTEHVTRQQITTVAVRGALPVPPTIIEAQPVKAEAAPYKY